MSRKAKGSHDRNRGGGRKNLLSDSMPASREPLIFLHLPQDIPRGSGFAMDTQGLKMALRSKRDFLDMTEAKRTPGNILQFPV